MRPGRRRRPPLPPASPRRPASPTTTTRARRRASTSPASRASPTIRTIGFGGGARVYYYYDGTRKDPLFAYTPYLHRVYVQAFASTGGAQDHVIDFDAPAFPDSDYRVRATLEYDAATDWPYFGIGARSMQPLSLPGAPGRQVPHDERLHDGDVRARQPNGTTYARYNVYELQRPVMQLALERNMLGGILRSMIGANISYVAPPRLHGRVDRDHPEGRERQHHPRARGADAPRDGLRRRAHRRLQRRLRQRAAPRPLARHARLRARSELRRLRRALRRVRHRALGSQYEYMRLMVSVRGFYSPFPRRADLVLAARGVYEIQTKGTPFFSRDAPAVHRRQPRGPRRLSHPARLPAESLRRTGHGARRTTRSAGRSRSSTPSSRASPSSPSRSSTWARVFDDVEQTTLAGWKRSQGMGLRIAWNEATIIMIDYGFSDEDSGLYLNFNHIF